MKINNKNIILLIGSITLAVGIFCSCHQHHGFSYDKQTKIYYNFIGIVHDKAPMPERSDFVQITLKVYTPDTVLVPTALRELKIDSLYVGDLYAALRMMHEGDSATFIFEGAPFYEHFIGQHYPYRRQPIYVDVRLHRCITLQEKRREVQQQWIERKTREPENIRQYVTLHHFTNQPTSDGIYYKAIRTGNGTAVRMNDSLLISYTIKVLDDRIIDGSARSGEAIPYRVGQGNTIPAWNKTLLLMHEGEKAVFLIPSSMAYGEKGKGNGFQYIVPPDTPILLEMEVKKIVR